jgi:hypothetical protein
MTEQIDTLLPGCPVWCHSRTEDETGPHAHVSQDLELGDGPEPMTARMIQLAGSDTVRVVVGPQVVTLDEAQAFGQALLRLVASAEIAEPGLGFIEVLAARTDLSTTEMALAAGLDVERLRAQRAGGQVLSRREFDRLALAVAQQLPR